MRRLIHLKDLDVERLGITATRGRGFAEAAAVSFERVGHKSGVQMQVVGDWQAVVHVEWEPLGENATRTWADFYEAVEHGAYGLAALLVEALADLTVVERSVKDTGFDYWVDHANRSDQQRLRRSAPSLRQRLEVSGILRGKARLSSRVAMKKRQTDRSKGLMIPAIIIVVEYGTPQAHMVRR